VNVQYGNPERVAEIKAGDTGFEVAGYVSTYGNVDHGGDVVMRGAFDHTIDSKGAVRFLFAHDSQSVLGKPLELRSDDKGLYGRFHISQTQLGKDVHTLLKDGALDSFSIGYIPTDVEFDDSGARLLKGVDLLECSVVAMPMNAQARVTGVKAGDKLELKEHVPLEDLLGQVGDHINIVVGAVKALQARRAESGKRKLTEAHLDAIDEFLRTTEAATKALESILHPPPPPATADLKLRLELARRLEGRRALETA
jgi:HK97 family phage prohead protease